MIIQAQTRLNEVLAIKQAVFQKGVHFGAPYKGAKNDTLLKPGATFLQQKYGMRAIHERMDTTIHVDTNDLSKSYIIVQNRCRIVTIEGEIELAQADAACSTFEDKYLFRGGSGKVCPECEGAVMKSKYPDRQTNDLGWYCRDCKTNFHSTDTRITEQADQKRLNENPLNLMDTIVAMAQKRAEVRATIKATGIDALFSPGDGVQAKFYDELPEEEVDTETGEITIVSGKKASTPPPTPKTPENTPVASYKGNLGAVFNAVLPLYDGKSPHMRNSIAALERDGKLTDAMSVDEAIEVIRQHKAEAIPA